MYNIEVDTQKFREAFAKFQGTSKRGIATNLRQQAKLLVVDVAKRTPPGNFYGSSWRRKAGEGTIQRDLAKIMRASSSKNAATDPASIHERYRRTRGRVTTYLKKGGRDERHKVKTDILRQYRNMVKARVGYMAAGWAQAANFLGASLPGWITRHSAKGYGSVNIVGDDINVNLGNRTIYPESRGLVERRVSAALKKRYWAMIKQADNYLKLAAQQAGFATTS